MCKLIMAAAFSITLSLSIEAISCAQSHEWPQWQGAARDGVWNEPNLISSFPESGAKVIWREKIGTGYSGPAVAAGRLFVMDYQLKKGDPTPNPGLRNPIEGTERIICRDAKSGEWLWEQAYDTPYRISFPAGPRCTPTVDGDRVYTLGAEGMMMCLSCADGSILWQVDLKERYGMKEAPIWGFAAHPLVYGDRIYTMIGGEQGAVVAMNKMTGEELWRACPDSAAGYCPPTIVMAGGTPQMLIWTPRTLNSINPEDGTVYWSFPLKVDYEMPIAFPVVRDNLLFASGEGASICLKLDEEKPSAEIVWEGKGFTTSHSPIMMLEGHAVGVDLGGQLRCISLQDGKRIWETLEPTTGGRPSGSGGGFMARCGDKFLIAGENGVLTIASITPQAYEKLDSAKILESDHFASGKNILWSHPAFAEGCCYWRNNSELVCVSLVDNKTDMPEDSR